MSDTPQEEAAPLSSNQGSIIIFLLVVAMGFPLFSWLRPTEKWEYAIEEFSGTAANRTGEGALKAETIHIDGKKLDQGGKKGWELVGVFLEMETAFPNFGKDDYVTGIRENVRPQKAVLIFKRRLSWW